MQAKAVPQRLLEKAEAAAQRAPEKAEAVARAWLDPMPE
jgi:hypothetical protein